MAGEGVSSLILLSASITVALIVGAAIYFTASAMKDSMENKAKVEENYLKSKIEIVNDLSYNPYNKSQNTLKLYVKNIGTTILSMNNTAVVVNGTIYSLTYPQSIHPIKGPSWAPQVVVEITVQLNNPLKNGDYVATVIADYGVKDTIQFRVG